MNSRTLARIAVLTAAAGLLAAWWPPAPPGQAAATSRSTCPKAGTAKTSG